jgi:hypothetical protein
MSLHISRLFSKRNISFSSTDYHRDVDLSLQKPAFNLMRTCDAKCGFREGLSWNRPETSRKS